jgi:hypothetical protein
VSRFGLTPEQLAALKSKCLKPEEIDGTPETQHLRVRELLHWFARGGNPKWLSGHAAELAFYVATGGKFAEIDLRELKMGAWREGMEAPESDRAMYQRIKAIATTEPSPEIKL